MGNVLYIFIGVDLWLIFIFQGWEIGCVLESGSFMKKILSIKVIDWEGCQGADASVPLQTACQQQSCMQARYSAKWMGNGKIYIYIFL